MVARVHHEPDRLAIIIERDGEEPTRLEARDGRQATSLALQELVRLMPLQAGDRLTIEAAE